MNKEKKQHKESIIGKIIYGFLMFSPLLAILFTSLYATFNPNAKDSFNDVLIDKQLQITQDYTYLDNQIYYVNFNQFETGNNVGLQGKFNIDFNSYNNLIDNSKVNCVILNLSTGTMYLNTYDGSTNNFVYYNTLTNVWGNTLKTITFEYIKYKSTSYTTYPYSAIPNQAIKLYQLTYLHNTLDNAFYYAINKTEESNLFNWSKNTGIYSVLTTTCNGIGITTTFIPFILAYWLIISLIYLIYDLVLVFVHVAHNKIHELEEF